MVKAALLAAHPDLQVEIIQILTSGDWRPEDGEKPLSSERGGKAQFAKEIEEALLARQIDLAVHSMKDMDSTLPKGLHIDCFLPHEDARECFLIHDPAKHGHDIKDWPPGTIIGTTSVRRAAMLQRQNPGVKIRPFRGNVPTRIQKLRSGQVDVTILAVAGLKRLGLTTEIDHIVSLNDMLPAAGQGIIGIETRVDDENINSYLKPINCLDTTLKIKTERSIVLALQGGCHSPIAVHAHLEDDQSTIHVVAETYAPDGSDMRRISDRRIVDKIENAVKWGYGLGEALKSETPASWLH